MFDWVQTRMRVSSPIEEKSRSRHRSLWFEVFCRSISSRTDPKFRVNVLHQIMLLWYHYCNPQSFQLALGENLMVDITWLSLLFILLFNYYRSESLLNQLDKVVARSYFQALLPRTINASSKNSHFIAIFCTFGLKSCDLLGSLRGNYWSILKSRNLS